MNYINALAFLLLESKFQDGEFKEIIEISKEALKLINHPDLPGEIEELLKRSQDEWEIEELLKRSQDEYNKEANEPNEPNEPNELNELKEAQETLSSARGMEQPDAHSVLEKGKIQEELIEENPHYEENKTVIIPPVVKEKIPKKAKEKAPDNTQITDKKSAYENMLRDVLKGLAKDACFTEKNDLIIIFNTQAWDGLSTNEQDEIINVLKYQVGKLKRDLSGACVSGHVALKGSEGQSLNTFYVQTVSDGKNGSTTVVY